METMYMTVIIPGSVMLNESYYLLNYQERSIELNFSQPVDSSTIKGNISLSDKDGSLDSTYAMISSGRKVIIAFRQDFNLNDGWKYLITIK